DIYRILTTSDRRIPRNDWGRAVMICNTWNKERYWPKAFLSVRNPDSDAYGAITLEWQIDLGKGIHQELLNDFTMTILSGGIAFWKWAHQEQSM
ncbi:MAG TPA: YbjN domain-containing protein, partial [Ktedonosporobacter sp.]|nr:YbjN domain-containing protein [Ktedonosporobacter sp.]